MAVGAIALVVVLFFVFKPESKSKPAAGKTPTPTPAGVACTGPTPPKANPKTYKAYPATVVKQDKKYEVTMETSCGTIVMVMDPKLAPKAVNNFVFLAREGFYNGLTFHRVEANAPFQLVQGGDPKGDGTGGPGYQFTIEKPTAKADDPHVRTGGAQGSTYLKGVVAMANSGGTASNGSQFFIDVSDVGLSPDYTVMGKTDDASLAVLQKMIKVPLASPPNDPSGQSRTYPQPPIYIIKVTVREIPA